MSETLRRVQTLVLGGDVHVSDHGYEELGKDAILVEDVVAGIATAVLVEDYPDRFRGPSILTLQHDGDGRPIHVVWAIPTGERRPVIRVTDYRASRRGGAAGAVNRWRLARFRAWFEEYDARLFDERIKQDARTGRLDELAEQALSDHRAGRTREL